MKFLWIISNGLTYWFEHTDQGDEDLPGSFLASPDSLLQFFVRPWSWFTILKGWQLKGVAIDVPLTCNKPRFQLITSLCMVVCASWKPVQCECKISLGLGKVLIPWYHNWAKIKPVWNHRNENIAILEKFAIQIFLIMIDCKRIFSTT